MHVTMPAYILNKSEIEVNINNISEKYVKRTLCLMVNWLQQHVSTADVYIFDT
jgi:hypothetical protein